jgi:flagellar export protein FliJ
VNRHFRLATVLRLRGRSERAAADALRAANATLEAARARVDTVLALLDQPAPPAGTPQQPLGEDTADLLAAAHHRARLRDELSTARGEVERQAREADLARETWLRARAALRAVESLQTRHVAALRAHELRVEQRAADELAARRVSTGGAA